MTDQAPNILIPVLCVYSIIGHIIFCIMTFKNLGDELRGDEDPAPALSLVKLAACCGFISLTVTVVGLLLGYIFTFIEAIISCIKKP